MFETVEVVVVLLTITYRPIRQCINNWFLHQHRQWMVSEMNINKTNENNSNQSFGVTVTPNINEWVKEVHVHHSVIVDADKKKDHWRKRELDAALVCGENLLKIR